MLAPICLFTYNRLAETQQTIEALQNNFLASESELFIFSDGPKNEASKPKVTEVRAFLHSVSGFKSVSLIEANENKGLARSIISGVSEIIKKYGKVIVLEDDLITSPNFLDFMNQALNFYRDHENIFSISGYSLDLPSLEGYEADYYLGYRASSWGWGTWLDRWEQIDWAVSDYKKFIFDPFEHIKFMRGGSDLPFMLWKQMNGKIDSWAIRWCFHQYRREQLTVFPSQSKVTSIGYGEEATHTKETNRFDTNLDDGVNRLFSFDLDLRLEKKLVKEFRNKFSVYKRIKDKF
ncbi:glycosyltransferase family 2 protein [Sunxiuqinia dokdonensis]|uniref:Glycosyl transferase n=1 Tax=Sunxiuqinia dokdonensis TaxID=1409788 RepID=A0A0L8VFG5_9BACT|nr:glycosyltransferase [Sunxiuqinia dokdonensis]KOH46927.1 glycosyl transferase [Sunxiuqinia dokdonensis]